MKHLGRWFYNHLPNLVQEEDIMNTIELKLKNDNNEYKDYNIYYNNVIVGILQTVESDTSEYTFGRQIRIFEDFQRMGIGTKVIDYIVNMKRSFKFCIATNSIKAVNFWKMYLNNTKFHKTNIRGEIWQIDKE